MLSTLIHQSPKTDSKHIVSDDKPDCNTWSDTSQNMIMKSVQSPVKVK